MHHIGRHLRNHVEQAACLVALSYRLSVDAYKTIRRSTSVRFHRLLAKMLAFIRKELCRAYVRSVHLARTAPCVSQLHIGDPFIRGHGYMRAPQTAWSCMVV
jgi:hypothetical protein